MVAADTVERKLQNLCERFGITHAQYNVLRILRGVHPNGHPRSEIIARLVQHNPDVTRLIDRLEQGALVSRGSDPGDKRLSLTFITEKGLDLLIQMQPAIEDVEREFRSRVSESDAQALSTICAKVASWE